MDTISLILHVTAAAALFGPQILLFFALTPATWFIDDEQLKRNVVSTVARRFGVLSAASILILIITGLYQMQALTPEGARELKWGSIFLVKMVLFVLLMGLMLVHTQYFGKKIRSMSDSVIEGATEVSGDLDYLRRQSWAFSFLMLVVTMILLWLGVMLGNHSYSLS
ncbi:MAG: CopD family protein [Chloroflexota bacterium]|nr:CopD family protein [Chloroflexota bacterium]